jgi:hypothetical protein
LAGDIKPVRRDYPDVGVGAAPRPSPILEGITVLTTDLLKEVIRDLKLIYKQFYQVPKTLAAVFSLIGDVTDEYPAIEDVEALKILAKPIIALEGDVCDISADKMLRRYRTAKEVVIARHDLEVDSYAAIAYAKSKNIPILLAQTDKLPNSTLNALLKLKPEKIIIAGGPVAISKEVEGELAKIAAVERIWGKNREETAVELAKAMDEVDVVKTIVVTDGKNASIGATLIAAGYKAPLVYVSGDEIPKVTGDYLVDHKLTKDIYRKPMKVVLVNVKKAAQVKIEALL